MSGADIAWILAAFSLVLLMFPGLAMLYGGMLNGRSVLNMMMMVMSSLALTAVVYVLIGHGLVLGNSVGGLGLIGNPFEYSFFDDFLNDDGEGGTLWAAFYVLFAAIAVALASSGAAGRMRFDAWFFFVPVWVCVVYAPVAHWVFAISDEESGYVGGWMRNVLDLHDFAGGTAVHMNAGAAGLALAMVLGRRVATTDEKPHNIPLMLIGAGMIAMGWMGFNGGTAGGANFLAQYVVLTTLLALCGGILGMYILERLINKNATLMGLGTGMIAGMVAITPVADAVTPIGAIFAGAIGSAAAFFAINLKRRHKIDDSVDVFAVHGIAGIAGALFVVFFGSMAAPAGRAGVFFGGEADLVWRELTAIGATLIYSFGMTYLLAWLMSKVMDIRLSEEEEKRGVDASLHREYAYAHLAMDDESGEVVPESEAKKVSNSVK